MGTPPIPISDRLGAPPSTQGVAPGTSPIPISDRLFVPPTTQPLVQNLAVKQVPTFGPGGAVQQTTQVSYNIGPSSFTDTHPPGTFSTAAAQDAIHTNLATVSDLSSLDGPANYPGWFASTAWAATPAAAAAQFTDPRQHVVSVKLLGTAAEVAQAGRFEPPDYALAQNLNYYSLIIQGPMLGGSPGSYGSPGTYPGSPSPTPQEVAQGHFGPAAGAGIVTTAGLVPTPAAAAAAVGAPPPPPGAPVALAAAPPPPPPPPPARVVVSPAATSTVQTGFDASSVQGFLQAQGYGVLRVIDLGLASDPAVAASLGVDPAPAGDPRHWFEAFFE